MEDRGCAMSDKEHNTDDRNEIKLSEYIDCLNDEKKPAEHSGSEVSCGLEELLDAVRQVKSLKEPALPEPGYVKKTVEYVARSIKEDSMQSASKAKSTSKEKPARAKKTRKVWFTGAAAAAILAAVIVFNFILPLGGSNIVHAMEQAYSQIGAYHGILEIVDINALGEETEQARVEVWADREGHYYTKDIGEKRSGVITVNNGQKKWQILPEQKLVSLFPAFPDPYLFTFQIGHEIENAKNALKIKETGEETVSGRKALILEVTPAGGAPYKLWIDKQTSLPLQKESAEQNAVRYRVAYTQIDFSEVIPEKFMEYSLPEGYTETDINPEQTVNNTAEAYALAGFNPKMPGNLPQGYVLDSIAVGIGAKTIRLYYSTDNVSKDGKSRIVLLQGIADSGFKPASTAILITADGRTFEIQSPVQGDSGILSGGGAYSGVTDISSIRWQEAGIEYAVLGDALPQELASVVNTITGGNLRLPEEAAGNGADITDPDKESGASDPDDSEDSDFKPKVKVEADMEIEENEQKSVDAGHSPWKLDPVFTAQVFVSLKMSPEGIVGDYPIQYDKLTVLKNTGKVAIIEVGDSASPVGRVYLRKLVRQDSTGIWTVVGYDPAG